MRVALVGLGDAGRHHARALAALSREAVASWTAVVGRDAARLAGARAELAVPDAVASFASLDALLDARVCDAVVLATPDGVHAAQVERAAAAGVHVLVEKPLALTRDDGARALEGAAAAGVRVRVGYHLRHHAAHAMVRARREELVGAVRHVSVQWAWPDPATSGWRARGEGARCWALAALGTHAIDLAAWLGGAAVARVAAVLDRNDAGVDRAADLSLALDSGALAHVAVAVTHRAVSRVHLAGDAGEVELVGTLGARGTGEVRHRAGRGEPQALAYEPVDPYLAQLRAFVAADAAEDEAHAAEALANLDVLDRAASSA